MPRSSIIVSKLIADLQQQIVVDKEQLATHKRELRAGANELLQKQVNALRVTLTNSAEDLQDLESELKEIEQFEASEQGRLKREDTARKLLVADAMVDVCVATAADADRALYAAQLALRRHHDAHAALTIAVGEAYVGVTDGSGFDVHHDQLFLLRGYSALSNGGAALAEWVVHSLRGFELENFIKVEGVQLHHNRHETIGGIDGVMLGRMWARLKEIGQRCGVTVAEHDQAALAKLSGGIYEAIQAAQLK